MEPEGSQEIATISVLRQTYLLPIPIPTPYTFKQILKLPSDLRFGFPSNLLYSFF
jgi:hypothetical protein